MCIYIYIYKGTLTPASVCPYAQRGPNPPEYNSLVRTTTATTTATTTTTTATITNNTNTIMIMIIIIQINGNDKYTKSPR